MAEECGYNDFSVLLGIACTLSDQNLLILKESRKEVSHSPLPAQPGYLPTGGGNGISCEGSMISGCSTSF